MSKEILFKTRNEWRNWLVENHNCQNEIWLIYYKELVTKESVKQPDAVEEALCYGWIDSIVKRIDDERYMQKFTPRNDKSMWSELNKKRVAKLIKNGKMTEAGMQKIRIAKKDGSWDKIKNYTDVKNIPIELEIKLSENKKARKYFDD